MPWPAAWAEGIGEDLTRAASISDYRILVVNPGFSVSTQWVYEKFALTTGQNIYNLENSQIAGSGEEGSERFAVRSILPENLANDLERVTVEHYPEIESLKKRLVNSGAVASLMSGSGPTVFGLFASKDKVTAKVCFEELKSEYRNTFLVDPLQ